MNKIILRNPDGRFQSDRQGYETPPHNVQNIIFTYGKQSKAQHTLWAHS